MSTRSGLRPRKSAAGANAPPAVQHTPAAGKVRRPAKVSPGEIISCVSQFRISSETLSSPVPVLTPMQGIRAAVADTPSNSRLDEIPEQSSTINALMETPAPATAQPSLYPDLAALTANADLYPVLNMDTKTPARRRLYAPITTAKKGGGKGKGKAAAGRKSLATQTVLPVTPTKPIDNSTVPKTTTFEFKFSAGLEEAGKKVLEELKMSSAALQAHMKDEAAKRAAGLESGEEASEAPASTGSRRFSAEHRKQFSKMASIADHYSARRAKAAAASASTADAGPPKSPYPPKTLKRKNAAEESNPSTPFKPPSILATSDTEILDESPISRKRAKLDGTPMTQPRSKTARFATPGPLTATPISKPLQYAGHQHGLTRTTAVKQSAMKQSSLPRVIRKEAAPSTPSKPLAVATPLKKETLLASPSKLRPSGAIAKSAAVVPQPGTPSPVKISLPITEEEKVELSSELRAPVFDREKLHKAAASASLKPSVRFADTEEEDGEGADGGESAIPAASKLPPARSLFDSGVILKPTLPGEKRKAVFQEEAPSSPEDGHQRLPAPTRNKRVRMDIPELNLTPMKGKLQSSPVKASENLLASVARKVTRPVRNPRINQLATPKRRTVLSPKTEGARGRVQKPRWK
ncbi:hypothetical protein EV426DRAFT_306165 [Tirmania nivea]|nr:hypothetical protein EV426DRAFT_306165 [Tirmania nivea]